MTITAEGIDSSGYSFKPSVTYYWDWDSKALVAIRDSGRGIKTTNRKAVKILETQLKRRLESP